MNTRTLNIISYAALIIFGFVYFLFMPDIVAKVRHLYAVGVFIVGALWRDPDNR